ncbi:hypothetical protein LTR66_002125 [Elasticomyces elasticus]|nr:hypothetical protein LTR50_001522 [Elasticomyces elasticus]KAK4998696.1 hypothetical protein LTR66_002125 [Elasticomyces elasticus]
MSQGVYFNASASSWTCENAIDPAIERFHHSLPYYATTPLHDLPDVAAQLGLSHVLVKDEGHRFGLPAFKILGASWAVFRAVGQQVGLPLTASLDEVSEVARKGNIRLVACSDGNWGRSVARMAKYLGITATVFVPKNIDQATRDKIAGEGAVVKVVQGSYDDGIAAARAEAELSDSLLVMDASWTGYEEIPSWVTDGYSTMLSEVSRQLPVIADSKSVTHAIVSVGVGSWAQSVVAYYKAQDPAIKIISVEPSAAASLKSSLEAGRIVTIETGDTIMCGMNCGTVSTNAWRVVKDGVDAAITVEDREAHEAVLELKDKGVMCGPCGAAPFAALKKVNRDERMGLGRDSVVVLFSTEGPRQYVVPM